MDGEKFYQVTFILGTNENTAIEEVQEMVNHWLGFMALKGEPSIVDASSIEIGKDIEDVTEIVKKR